MEANDVRRNVKVKSYKFISFDSFCSWATIFNTLLGMTQALMSESGIFKAFVSMDHN